MTKVNPQFAKKMSQVESALDVRYCFGCSACVAECPAALRFKEFNPREIVISTLLGVAENLIEADSVIWQCATCYKCYERCPQNVHPVDVITALKNISFAAGNAPEGVSSLHKAVLENGSIIAPSEAIQKRRAKLGLPAFSHATLHVPEASGKGGE
ncbi:MAG: 4Fe-4S dicluster domain-containing protein [Actinomycetota bacterium]|nr:4Fe-4S dicluster domain-containing protein [Actinomycetota bacterium]